MNLNNYDLDKLNSLTKYPSIPTMHKLGEKGRLLEELYVQFDEGEPLLYTEKIDGTNARILGVQTPEGFDYFIGSREELLYAKGDRIYNPSQGIVETVRGVADQIIDEGDALVVFYGEAYGGRIGGGAKHYRGSEEELTGFRLFDVVIIPFDLAEKLLAGTRESIAAWRDGGGQTFLVESALIEVATKLGMQTTPRLSAAPLVTSSIAATQEWLQATIQTTHAPLLQVGAGLAEGIVVRTPDRQKIAKLRFEDYRRSTAKVGR